MSQKCISKDLAMKMILNIMTGKYKKPAHVVQLVHKPWVCILVIVMNQTTYSMQLVQLPS